MKNRQRVQPRASSSRSSRRSSSEPKELVKSVEASSAANLTSKALTAPGMLAPSDVVRLHRTLGSQAVQRLLAERSASPVDGMAVTPSREGALLQREDDKESTATQSRWTTGARSSSQGTGTRQRRWVMGGAANDKGKEKEDEDQESASQTRRDRALAFDAGDHELESVKEEEESSESEARAVEAAFPARSEFSRFKAEYEDIFSDFPNLHMDVTARLNEFSEMTRGYDVENYVVEVLSNYKVKQLLEQIDILLRQADGGNARKTASMIADWLLFASLVPSRQTEYAQRFGRSRFQRLSVNVLNRGKLVEMLIQLTQQLAAKQDAGGIAALEGTDLKKNDSLAQRMLKLSLTNMQSTARAQLQDDPLFQSLLDSPDVVGAMMASGGAVEQQFLNTCAAAAVNQEIQGRASNIASLLVAGNGVADFIEKQLMDETLQEPLGKRHKGIIRNKVTIGQVAGARVQEARTIFAEIQLQAIELLKQRPVDIQAIQALTRPWSRAMQKLSGVVMLAKGSRKVPVLTRKRIAEQWGASAALATVMGGFADRPARRGQGIEEDSYRAALAGTVDISTSGAAEASSNLNIAIGMDKTKRPAALDIVWDRVLEAGGTEVGVPGHAMYLQAVLKDNRKHFMLGDPKIDKQQFFTIAQFDSYTRQVRGGKFLMREDVLEEITPKGYILKDEVKLYTSPNSVGRETINVVEMGPDTVILKAEEESELEGGWYSLTIRQPDGKEVDGWADPRQIELFG